MVQSKWFSVMQRLVVGGAFAAAAASTAAYPTQQIEMIIPYPPGGSMDALGRVLQPALARELGVPVVVQNRAGAGGNLGTGQAARATPDGHTFVITTNAVLTINPHVYSNMGFEPTKDLAPVSLVANGPMAIGVSSSSDIMTLQDLIDQGRAGKEFSYATPGVASPHHLTGVYFAEQAGIEMTHVPYKGIGPGITDLLGGHVDVAISTVAGFVPFLPDGRIRVLAITGAERYDELPDVPSIAETFPGFDANAWFGALVPAGTPQEAIDKLSAAIAVAMEDEAVQRAMHAAALVPIGGSAEDLVDMIDVEYKRWGEIVSQHNITAD